MRINNFIMIVVCLLSISTFMAINATAANKDCVKAKKIIDEYYNQASIIKLKIGESRKVEKDYYDKIHEPRYKFSKYGKVSLLDVVTKIHELELEGSLKSKVDRDFASTMFSMHNEYRKELENTRKEIKKLDMKLEAINTKIRQTANEYGCAHLLSEYKIIESEKSADGNLWSAKRILIMRCPDHTASGKPDEVTKIPIVVKLYKNGELVIHIQGMEPIKTTVDGQGRYSVKVNMQSKLRAHWELSGKVVKNTDQQTLSGGGEGKFWMMDIPQFVCMVKW